WLRRRAACGLLGVNRAPWNCLKAAFNNHQVVGFKTFVDNHQFTHLRPGLDAAPLDYVLIVDDEEKFSLLVETDRVSWDEQRVALLQRGDANPHEQTGKDRPIRVGKDPPQL